MAIYEYKCENLECSLEKFEVMTTMSESSKIQYCPRCKREAKKLMSSFGLNTSNFANHSLDVAIGKDSERKWNIIRERKEKVIEPAIKAGKLKRGMPKINRKDLKSI